MNPQNGQTPLDYLNQIAPQAPKKQLFTLNFRTVMLGAAAVVVLIIIIAAVSSALSGNSKEPWQQLAARIDTTTEVVDGATKHIKSSQLRSINSDLKLYLTNTRRDIAAPLESLDINPEQISKDVVAKEKGTGITERLEDGRLNARYDTTYAREMKYQVATILSLLQKLYTTNVTPPTKATLKVAYDNLLPTYTTLSEFNTTTE
jgi:hypothetical protein